VDTRSIAVVLLKIAGLVLIGACVTQLPSYFPVRLEGGRWSPAESLVAAAITVGPAALLGACFWFFPGTIANKIVTANPGTFESSGLSAILLVAIAVLGLFLMAHGAIDLVYHVATLVRLQHLNPDIAVAPPTIFAGAIASVVEIVIGLAFCIGRRGIGRIIERARG
jgi:hypothetical protein